MKQYQETAVQALESLKDMRVVGLMVFLVIVLLVSWSGVKAIDTNYGLQKEISRLKQENAIKKLANQNIKLQNDYFKTPQYLELAARKDFGLAAPGETVLIVPKQVALAHTVDLPKAIPADQSKAEDDTRKPTYVRNFNAWMDFLLHRNAAE